MTVTFQIMMSRELSAENLDPGSLFLVSSFVPMQSSFSLHFAYTHLPIQSHFRCSYPPSLHHRAECFPPNFPETIFPLFFILPFFLSSFFNFCRAYYSTSLIDYLLPFLQYFLFFHSTCLAHFFSLSNGES